MNLRWVRGCDPRRNIGVRWCSLLSLILALGTPACSYGDKSDDDTQETEANGAAGASAMQSEGSAGTGGDSGLIASDGNGMVFIVEDEGDILIVDDPSSPPPCELGADTSSDGLDAYSVSNDDVGRPAVYSWTTAEQIDELRGDPTLLTRVANENGERGRAADFILATVGTDEFTDILARPEYDAKRFGWTNPWATLLGWAGETYGDQLLEIRFKPEAFIGRLVTSTREWSFFDVDNNPVEPELVKAEPERIAAFLFVDDRDVFGCGGSFSNGPALREYVVCNESMIAGWSALTPEILGELERAVDVLGDFRSELAEAECDALNGLIDCWRGRVIELWRSGPETLMENYETALAIPNELYAPSTANIDRLIERLNTVMFDPDPLVYTTGEGLVPGAPDAGLGDDEVAVAPDAG